MGGILLGNSISSRQQLIAAIVLALLFGFYHGMTGTIVRGGLVFCSTLLVCLPLPGMLATWLAQKRVLQQAESLGAALLRPQRLVVLAETDTLLFPYRGVLTQGEPHIAALMPEGMSQAGLLALAAAAERDATHPIGCAIYATAMERCLRLPRVSAQAEQAHHGAEALCTGDTVRVGAIDWLRAEGVHFSAELLTTADQMYCRGESVVALSMGKRARGLIALSYDMSDSVRAVLAELARADMTPILFTSSAQKFAHALAKQLGISTAYGNLSAKKCARETQFLQSRGHIVALLDMAANPSQIPPGTADVHLVISSSQSAETGKDTASDVADIAIPSIAALPPLLALSRRMSVACNHSHSIAFFGALIFLLSATIFFPWFDGSFMSPHIAVTCLLFLVLLALLPIRRI